MGIMDELRSDHRNMESLLSVLESQMEVFRRGETPDYELLTQTIEYCLNYPERFHHPKEDLLYRHLARKDEALVDKIGDLEAAHGELTALTQRVASAVDAILKEGEVDRKAVVNVTEAFVRTYRQHIAAEDSVFFPLAERELEKNDWEEIEAAAAEEESDPLFGETLPTEESYRRLRDNLLRWSSPMLDA
jgi:hemerythrin-like domain-containing protein